MMIKVLNVISDTNFGGAGRVLLNYLKNYDKSKFDVSVVLPCKSALKEHIEALGVNIIEVDGLYDRSYNKADVKVLCELFEKEKPDVVHSHGALSARIAAVRCGIKTVFTRHSVFDVTKDQIRFPKKQINRYINRKYADAIIAVSPAAKDNLLELGTADENICVVFNGVDKITPSDMEAADEMRRKYDIKPSDFVCSIIARLEEVKGHEYVIKAAEILKNGGYDNIKIIIAGTGNIEEKLRRLAEEHGVTDIVKFTGFINEIPTLLSITHVQLNASYGTEATSMALLEGFSIGVPAVVSDFGGNPYVVENNVNGLIYPKKDEKALAGCILNLYNDLDLLSALSKGAVKVYNEKFTSKVMAEETEKVYESVLNKNGGEN